MVDVRIMPEPSRQAALQLGAGNLPEFGPIPPKASPSIEVTVERLDPLDGIAAETAPRGTEVQPVRVASAAPASPTSPPPYDGMTNIQSAAPTPRPPAQAAGPTELEPGEPVQVVPVGTAPKIFVQAGAFARYDNANRLRARLTALGHPVRVTQVYITHQPMFRVRVGPLASVESADRTLDRMVAAGYPDAHIVID
jgi:rare lipoprotein A